MADPARRRLDPATPEADHQEPSHFARGVVYGVIFGLVGWALLVVVGVLLYHLLT